MSDPKNPVYAGAANVQPFLASSVGVVKEIPNPKRSHAMSSQEQLEELRRLTMDAAEKLGRERGHAKGFLHGFEQGKEIGRKEAKEEAERALAEDLDEFVKGLEEISEELQTRIQTWFEESEAQMTELAMAAVRKILCAELTLSRESALEIVKDALRDVTHSRHARIKVNPFDSPLLRDHRAEILTAARNLREVEFVSDSSIPAGCIVETEGGVVDATTETKLILLENSLRLAS